MVKKSSFQFFFIDKGAYDIVKIFINKTICIRITVYWSETYFIMSAKKNIGFVKLFEISFGSNIFSSLTEFQSEA